MAQENAKRIFNLLKPYAPPPTAWDKIYEWLLGRARAVMIISEVVVALTFVAKVVVDIDAKNLDEMIQQRDFQLISYAGTVEPAVRKLQQKSVVYQKLWDQASSYTDELEMVNSLLPANITNLSIAFKNSSLVIRGSGDIQEFADVEAELKKDPNLTRVEIAGLNTDAVAIESGQADYVINAEMLNVDHRELNGDTN